MKRFRFSWLQHLIPFFFMGMAWKFRFLLDDAFITFRYSRNLARGLGPVYNPGERVEGYTNFLWMLLMSIPEAFNWDTPLFAQILGIGLLGINLWLIWRIAELLIDGYLVPLIVLVLSGLNFTVFSFAGCGLETSLVSTLLSLSVFISLKIDQKPDSNLFLPLLLGLISGLTYLTRPDAVIFAAGLGGWLWFRQKGIHRKKAFASLLTFSILLLAHLFWRTTYYDAWVPNTFLVKGNLHLLRGLKYLGAFFLAYAFPAGFLLWNKGGRERVKMSHWALASVIILPWLSYIFLIGGDFMEFRMMMPVIPYIYMLLLLPLQFGSDYWKIGKARIFAVLTIWVLASVAHPFLFYKKYVVPGIIGVESLDAEISDPVRGHAVVGKRLGEAWSHNPEIRIAIGHAGAIPYYTEAHTLDMLGLNNRWVAQNGLRTDELAGHSVYAPPQYIIDQGTHLQISRWITNYPNGFPGSDYFYLKNPEMMFHFGLPEGQKLPPNTRLLLVPLHEGYFIHLVYFHPHPSLDEWIENEEIRAFPVK